MNLELWCPRLLIRGDNESSIKLVKNAEFHTHTKHIDVQHHYIRELVSKGELTIEWIMTKEMLGNGFTKALPRETFESHRTKLGLTKE